MGELIHWSEKYSTGVAEIDQQHKQIILQLNKLHSAITEGKGREVIEGIIAFAGKYAAEHFAFEENCMNQHRCPVAQRNKEAHAQFIRRFGEIQSAMRSGKVDTMTVLEVYKELRDWIKNHILQIDTNLRACVGQKKAP